MLRRVVVTANVQNNSSESLEGSTTRLRVPHQSPPQTSAPGHNTQINVDLLEHSAMISSANQTFESLDFEVQENEVLIAERRRRNGAVIPPKWKVFLIVILIGMLTGAVAYGIDTGIKGLNTLKLMALRPQLTFNATKINNDTDQSSISRPMPFVGPFFTYVAINLVYVSVAAALVIFGEPVARGSGIGEVKCYLNGIRIPRVVRLKTLICKAVGILFSVASGLPCGKEGPMIHSGAAIGSGVATGKSTKLHCDTGLFKEFRSDQEKRNFVTAGAAAGVGAAFGAPIGGVLFAVEEVGSFWRIDITVMVFVCAAVTPWTLGLLQHPESYKTGVVRGLIDFGEVTGTYRYADIPFLILLGIIGGGFGALFIWSNLQLTKLRRKIIKYRWHRFVEVLLVSFLVSAVLITLVCVGYTCVPISRLKGDYVKSRTETFGCEDGYYNDMATYFLPGMEESISLLVHTDSSIPLESLMKQFVPYFVLTVLTYGIHVPSGLFLPSLALGATFGHAYAQLWNKVLPDSMTLQPHSFALFGGAAVLAGVVRMTISVIVIIMEATGNTTFFYPLCIICICAKFFGDLFTHGVYDAHIFFNKVPLLENQLENEYCLLTAEEVMNPVIITHPTRTTVGALVTLLKAAPLHNAILTVDPATGRFRGILLRRSALILIDKRAWERRLEFNDFVKSDKERQLLRLKKYQFFNQVSKEDALQELDVTPYIDQWPITFGPTTPLPRIHRTLTQMGVRHIIIVDERHHALGLIGRKQLCFLEKATPKNIASMQKMLPRLGSRVFPSTQELSPFVSQNVDHPYDRGHRCGMSPTDENPLEPHRPPGPSFDESITDMARLPSSSAAAATGHLTPIGQSLGDEEDDWDDAFKQNVH